MQHRRLGRTDLSIAPLAFGANVFGWTADKPTSHALLDRFVGRTDVGATWIEALPPPDPNDHAQRPARAGDSVSPIIIASNDLAAAWAVDDRGAPLHPLIPGGPRQREMALRGGVNLVMYALTGNYKADQVHAKDLLERLAH